MRNLPLEMEWWEVLDFCQSIGIQRPTYCHLLQGGMDVRSCYLHFDWMAESEKAFVLERLNAGWWLSHKPLLAAEATVPPVSWLKHFVGEWLSTMEVVGVVGGPPFWITMGIPKMAMATLPEDSVLAVRCHGPHAPFALLLDSFCRPRITIGKPSRVFGYRASVEPI